MADDESRLRELNASTFAAEEHKPMKGWVDALHGALTDDFRLRRGIGEIEDRERMITRLSRTTRPPSRVIVDEDVALIRDIAIVHSLVRVGEAAFRNTKLFVRTNEDD